MLVGPAPREPENLEQQPWPLALLLLGAFGPCPLAGEWSWVWRECGVRLARIGLGRRIELLPLIL